MSVHACTTKKRASTDMHVWITPRPSFSHTKPNHTVPDAAGATTTGSSTAPAAVAPRPAIASVGPNCVKQGYLWKRSSNVLKDWKRRFFFIRVRAHACR